MAPTPSLRITKSFDYRGSTKLWSNRYHFQASGAITDITLGQMLDAVVVAESAIYDSAVEIVKGEAFDAGTDFPRVTQAYTTFGTIVDTDATKCPGDCAAVGRWTTDARSTKNHPVYLFSYWHGVLYDATLGKDVLNEEQAALMDTYADSWVSGITYGGGAGTIVRHGPNGVAALSASVLPFVRHRDFRG